MDMVICAWPPYLSQWAPRLGKHYWPGETDVLLSPPARHVNKQAARDKSHHDPTMLARDKAFCWLNRKRKIGPQY